MSSPLTDDERDFIASFADHWHEAGMGRMEGRILGYLMITASERSSSADLARALEAGHGAISVATRNLVDEGFIKRTHLPGDRSHYFTAPDDVWGSFLGGERRWVVRMGDHLEKAEESLALSPSAARRVWMAREYMSWLAGYSQQMVAAWHAHIEALAPPDNTAPADDTGTNGGDSTTDGGR